jgi:hypothetical protein
MFRATLAVVALVTATAPLELATPASARPLTQNGFHPQSMRFGAGLVTLGPHVYQARPQRGVRPPRPELPRPRCVEPGGRVVDC